MQNVMQALYLTRNARGLPASARRYNVARALELYPRKGCIAEGSDADLVLLDEGYEIDTMLAKGRIMMQDKQVLVKGTFE